MKISKFTISKIYEKLLNEGLLIVPKDQTIIKKYYKSLNNIHIMKIMKSLKVRKFVNEIYCFQNYYWSLTSRGVFYLKNFFVIK
uniref:Ribosomal protein S10 n=1 Tax=Amorphochlora amoebiformis TaxID=1561963 RepID=A0A0H5BKK1_9EUKA|nr:ribosomal protein S10 [Amorphochlora amoebiformis]|mmetsp:Transcript_2677/g.3948  ORF Transcript_2677/g.3948 Transcript_2677/m.3948 type:complete len:84 (-) Transcript_2677:3843-4094(-)